MNKALFLDRDGVINLHNGYVFKKEKFIFNEDIFEVCSFFKSISYKIIIITNQAGIAKGIFSLQDLKLLNLYMINEFKKKNIIIDNVYFCPHHPDYDLKCFNRKPSPGMLIQARDDFNIDLKKSILIGDQFTDIEAGNSAGVGKSYLFNSALTQKKTSLKYKRIHSLLEVIEHNEKNSNHW